ncbi:hypothetical protein OH77DRAFT_1553832, partial [Trametes cingulata]
MSSTPGASALVVASALPGGDHRRHGLVTASADSISPRPPRQRRPRRPQPQNVIASSPLRPFVLANERLAQWKTPFSVQFQQHTSSFLPPSASFRIFQTILNGLEPGTRKNYGAGLLRFHQFCDLMGIHEDMRMPAPEPIIAAFVAHHAGQVRHDTIAGWLAGLAAWHALYGAPWRGEKMLAYTKKGAKKL